MKQIRNQEADQVKMPNDQLNVALQLSAGIEQAKEYLDDEDGLLARTDNGLYYRMKLKVTLSYKQAPG